MGEDLKCAIDAYGEQVRAAFIPAAAHQQKVRHTYQHRKRPSQGLPAMKVKQGPEEDEPAASSSAWMARLVEPSDTVAGAIAALPQFGSLKYPTKEEDAGRTARSSSPALKEGGDDPGDQRRQHLSWDQDIWEDGVDGRFGANVDENCQHDKNIVDDILELRIVWSARGGRRYEAAIKKKYRQYMCRALEFNFKFVEDCFHRDAVFHEQMTRNRWRPDTISRVEREGEEYLTLGHRNDLEHEKFEGIIAADEDEPFSWAATSCPSRGSVPNYWKKFNAQWKEWVASQLRQSASVWDRTSLRWGSGGWNEGCESSSSSRPRRW